MMCDVCHAETASPHKAIINNVYYAHVCHNCIGNGLRQPTDAAFNRERAKEDNAKEILQPFNRDGSVNADFASAYPKQAQEMFNQDDLKGVA